MKWTCTPNLLLIALTSAAPLQIPDLLQANVLASLPLSILSHRSSIVLTVLPPQFDNLQPGTRLQNTIYTSLKFSGLIVKDKGPRAIFPDTEPNYALKYYDPVPRGPLMTIAGTGSSSFDLESFAAGCLWDTATSAGGARNVTSLPPIPGTANELVPRAGPLNNATTSLDAPHYPCVECRFELACRSSSGVVARQESSWRPGTSWSSNIMARFTALGQKFRGMGFCDVRVTQAAVDVEEVIVVLDSIKYRVNAGQAAVDVT